jgi:hypothetical protein
MIVMRRVIEIFVIVAMKIGVDVRMRMHRVVVSVRVRMDDQAVIARRTSSHSSRGAAHQARGRIGAEQDQHDCDREFHREPEPGWNRNLENYDRCSHYQHGHSVPESPYDTDSRGGTKAMFAAQDGGDGDYVIGIGRMAHPEHESEESYRKRRGIGRDHRCGFLCRSIQPTVHPNFSLTEANARLTWKSRSAERYIHEQQYRTLPDRGD